MIYISKSPRVCEQLTPLMPSNVELGHVRTDPGIVYCSEEFIETQGDDARVVQMAEGEEDETDGRNGGRAGGKGRGRLRGRSGKGLLNRLDDYILPIICIVIIVILMVIICVLKSKLKKATTFNQRMSQEKVTGIQFEEVTVNDGPNISNTIRLD